MDMDQRTRSFGNSGGRIILLGDGTEVLTDSANEDMLDNDEDDDKEVQGQVSEVKENEDRGNREGTPGPGEADKIESSPSSTKTDASESTSGEPKMTTPADDAKQS